MNYIQCFQGFQGNNIYYFQKYRTDNGFSW